MRKELLAASIAMASLLLDFGGLGAAETRTNSVPLKFIFGAMDSTLGTPVGPDVAYSNERGYGFEPGADFQLTNSPLAGLISDKPFLFSVAVPEGNYRVIVVLGGLSASNMTVKGTTIELGGLSAAADTTVKAELRRLFLEQVHSQPGGFQRRSFIVNVRQARISGDREVRLTPREKTSETRAWDDRLTLEFNGTHPSVMSLQVDRVDVPTLFLIGDSTVCDQSREPYASWGQMITRFFKPEIAVANHAESGESIAGALAKGRFEKIWSQMKTNDYLIVQFGHNDMKSTATNALQTYTDDLRKVVDEARKRGGTPILCTPVSRRSFDDKGKITNSFRDYPDAVKLVAKEKNVPLIDLQQKGAAFYEAMGPDGSHKAFANARENTHHNNYGSYEIAKCVLQGIRENKIDLARFIVDDFKGFDPSHPDPIESFKVPASPEEASETPAGN